jgi:outer membrane protein assembly factor BamB
MLVSSALTAVSCALSPALQRTGSSDGSPARTRATRTATPTSPFPEQVHWTLQLNNAIIAPGLVTYSGSVGYLSIAGDRIAAFDLLSGALQWMVSARPQSVPAFANGRLFIEESGSLAALEAKDGSVAWRVPLTAALAAPLAADHEWLVGTTADAVLMFRTVDGMLVWRHDLGTSPHGAPAVSGDRIFIPVIDGRVIALRGDTGETLWQRRLGAAANNILASGDRLFVGSDDNYLYCLDAKDGARVWRTRTGADVVSRPTVDENRVYFISLDNVLRALNRGNGVQLWKRALSFRPAWPPVNVFDTVVVVGPMGPLHAYYLKDGTPAGEMTVGADVPAAPVYAFESPLIAGPMLVVITRNLAGDAKIAAVSRAFEPTVATALPPLPGAQQPLPTTLAKSPSE